MKERQQPERQSERPVWDEASLEHVHQVPDKAQRVRVMFDAIVPRYELVNTLTTLGLDGMWRRRLVRALELPQGAAVLDIACGTGQVVRALRKYRHEVARLWGLDFSWEMVREAGRLDEAPGTQFGGSAGFEGFHGRKRRDHGTRQSPFPQTVAPERKRVQPPNDNDSRGQSPFPTVTETRLKPVLQAQGPVFAALRRGKPCHPASYLQGDVQHLPFADRSFDVVTCVFGVRNFSDPAAGLAEMLRVLRPGGMVGILEFSMPRAGLLAGLYKVYFRLVLPRLASWLSGDTGGAYRYLQKSVEAFSQEVDLQERLGQCGFERVAARQLTLGVVTLYTAYRPVLSNDNDSTEC